MQYLTPNRECSEAKSRVSTVFRTSTLQQMACTQPTSQPASERGDVYLHGYN